MELERKLIEVTEPQVAPVVPQPITLPAQTVPQTVTPPPPVLPPAPVDEISNTLKQTK